MIPLFNFEEECASENEEDRRRLDHRVERNLDKDERPVREANVNRRRHRRRHHLAHKHWPAKQGRRLASHALAPLAAEAGEHESDHEMDRRGGDGNVPFVEEMFVVEGQTDGTCLKKKLTELRIDLNISYPVGKHQYDDEQDLDKHYMVHQAVHISKQGKGEAFPIPFNFYYI